MMENAAEAVIKFIKNKIPEYMSRKYIVFCGPGNNGGDGAAVARKLFTGGVYIEAVFTGDVERIDGDLLTNYSIIKNCGIKTSLLTAYSGDKDLARKIEDFDIIIDAIFGIGCHGEPDEKIGHVIQKINDSGKKIISIDTSGVYADGGASGSSITADHTVTFGLLKLGIADFPGKDYAGDVHNDNIGIPGKLLDA